MPGILPDRDVVWCWMLAIEHNSSNSCPSPLDGVTLGCPGLEPGTDRLKAEYSTIELATLLLTMLPVSTSFCKRRVATTV